MDQQPESRVPGHFSIHHDGMSGQELAEQLEPLTSEQCQQVVRLAGLADYNPDATKWQINAALRQYSRSLLGAIFETVLSDSAANVLHPPKESLN